MVATAFAVQSGLQLSYRSAAPRRGGRQLVTPVRAMTPQSPYSKDNTWEKAETPGRQGVAAAARQWPPKPITELGQPRPEDDPANYENGKRVRGPPQEEVDKKRAEMRKNSPFSNPEREGGTQAGGSGEGSGA